MLNVPNLLFQTPKEPTEYPPLSQTPPKEVVSVDGFHASITIALDVNDPLIALR
jgi:hypothetical protein